MFFPQERLEDREERAVQRGPLRRGERPKKFLLGSRRGIVEFVDYLPTLFREGNKLTPPVVLIALSLHETPIGQFVKCANHISRIRADHNAQPVLWHRSKLADRGEHRVMTCREAYVRESLATEPAYLGTKTR